MHTYNHVINAHFHIISWNSKRKTPLWPDKHFCTLFETEQIAAVYFDNKDCWKQAIFIFIEDDFATKHTTVKWSINMCLNKY